MRLPIRVAGIIIRNGEILLIHRVKNNSEYWVFPGGGLENTDLSNKEGLLREIEEETCLEVKVKKLLYQHDYGTNKGLYFLCDYISGKEKLGESIEKERMKEGKDDLYEPKWYLISELKKMLIYPLEIRDLLIFDVENTFDHEPIVQKMETKDLREE